MAQAEKRELHINGVVADSEASDASEEEESDDEKFSCCCGRRAPPAQPAQPLAEKEAPYFTDHGANQRRYSHDGSEHVTDEVFNAASHLMGGMLSLLGSVVLITRASTYGDPWAIVGFSLYGLSLNFLFWASFAHHGIRGSDALMKLLRKLDYVAIYFLIPGTMSPVCLVCLHSRWEGWVFFGACWFLALLGVSMQALCTGGLELPKWASMTMYVTLGWFGAFLAMPALDCVQFEGVVLMAVGGILYTAGGVIFTMQCPNPVPGKFGFHEIWHIFVLAGAAVHWVFQFLHVLPHRGG